MAGLKCIASSTGTKAVPQSTGTALKTLLQIKAPANQIVKLGRPTLELAGIDPIGPQGMVTLNRSGADDGTHTTTPTPVKLSANSALPAGPQTTAKGHFSAEPTGGVIVYRGYVHPQGKWVCPIPLDDLKPGETLQLVFHIATAVDYTANIPFEE